MAAVLIHSRSDRYGILAMTWRCRQEAAAYADTLQAAASHIRLVLADYETIEQNAAHFQSLQAYLRQIEALVGTIRHDMGNRLNVLTLLLAEIMEGAPEHRESLQRALGHSIVVNALCKELSAPGLDAPVNPDDVHVEDLIALLPSMVSAWARNRQVQFEMDVPEGLPPIWGDRIGLLRVLDNLLNNAVKYNRPGGRVWLRVRLAARGDAIEFEVGDTGRGIPQGAHARLFEFGYRVDGDGEIKGEGIGLWSCRRIVEAHGGHIWAENAPGEGSRFFFTVPLVKAER